MNPSRSRGPWPSLLRLWGGEGREGREGGRENERERERERESERERVRERERERLSSLECSS